MMLSDHIVVMSKGHVEQEGSPREIYDHPATRFVAGFIGEMNFLDAGNGKQLAVRPENVVLLPAASDGLRGTVRTVMMLGHYLEMTLDTERGLVKAYLTAEEAEKFSAGSEVGLQFSHACEYDAEEA